MIANEFIQSLKSKKIHWSDYFFLIDHVIFKPVVVSLNLSAISSSTTKQQLFPPNNQKVTSINTTQRR